MTWTIWTFPLKRSLADLADLVDLPVAIPATGLPVESVPAVDTLTRPVEQPTQGTAPEGKPDAPPACDAPVGAEPVAIAAATTAENITEEHVTGETVTEPVAGEQHAETQRASEGTKASAATEIEAAETTEPIVEVEPLLPPEPDDDEPWVLELERMMVGVGGRGEHAILAVGESHALRAEIEADPTDDGFEAWFRAGDEIDLTTEDPAAGLVTPVCSIILALAAALTLLLRSF